MVGGEVGEVGAEGVVDLAGDVAFEAADDFALGFPFAGSPGRVVAGARAAAQPADCDEVERAVGLAIAAVVEPVAAGLPEDAGSQRVSMTGWVGCVVHAPAVTCTCGVDDVDFAHVATV